MPCLGWFGAGRPRFRANLPCWTGCAWFKIPRFVMAAAATANQWLGLWTTDKPKLFWTGLTARRTFVVVPIHSEVNRLGHPDRRSAIHRQHPCGWLPALSRPTPARRSSTC